MKRQLGTVIAVLALFCVGAHMSGLRLNGALTQRGGRFVRPATTTDAYRFYVLGDRPGLVRADRGAAIAGEIWALPTAAIGAVLCPPLSSSSCDRDGLLHSDRVLRSLIDPITRWNAYAIGDKR